MATLMNDQYQISSQDANPVGGTAIYGAVYFCQSFTPSVTGDLTAVHLAMSKSGSPGSLEVLIYVADGSDKPTGSVLASQVVSSSGIPTGLDPANVDVTFSSPATLTASTKYVIVCRQQSDAGDLFNSIRWFGTGNTDSNYTGGTQHYSTNSGSTWNNQTKDFTFVTTMSVAVATPGLDRWAYGSHPNGSSERIELSTDRKAQTFVPSVTQPLKKLYLRFYRIDSQTGGNVNFEIYAVDGSNKPTGSALATQSVADASIPSSNILSGLEVTFTTPANLTLGTTYAFVINCPNASGSARYSVAHSGSSPDSYTGGQSWASTDSGSTWTHDTSARDLAFGTFMLEPTETSQTILSDATVMLTTEQTILSDAFHGAIASQTILSDAIVFIESEQNILSDAFHGQETTQTIFSDASIGVIQTVTIFSDAFVGQETNQTIFSDAIVFITTEETILSAATILVTSLQTILSSASISASVVQTINANASVAMTTTQTITGGAVITVREPVLKLYVVT